MKSNNLEEQLADKLGNRSIAPSQQAWERIAHNRQIGKGKKKKTALYYVAAVILFLLSTGYGVRLLLNDRADVTNASGVVESDKANTIIAAEKTVSNPQEALPLKQAQEIVYDEQKKMQVNGLEPVSDKVEAIAISDQNSSINEKLPELKVVSLPVVKSSNKDKNYEQEVAVLLKEAAKELAADKQFAAPTDDTALLKEAEAEMNEYYRNKAMKIFSFQNKTIRIAVKNQ